MVIGSPTDIFSVIRGDQTFSQTHTFRRTTAGYQKKTFNLSSAPQVMHTALSMRLSAGCVTSNLNHSASRLIPSFRGKLALSNEDEDALPPHQFSALFGDMARVYRMNQVLGAEEVVRTNLPGYVLYRLHEAVYLLVHRSGNRNVGMQTDISTMSWPCHETTLWGNS